MREIIISNLTARFAAFQDLLEQTEEADLQSRLEAPKSKSLAEHLWCVVGARESYARAIEAGETEHGCTVHYVSEEMDGGEIIAQATVPVFSDDTEETLAARVLVEEHKLYPQVIADLCH